MGYYSIFRRCIAEHVRANMEQARRCIKSCVKDKIDFYLFYFLLFLFLFHLKQNNNILALAYSNCEKHKLLYLNFLFFALFLLNLNYRSIILPNHLKLF